MQHERCSTAAAVRVNERRLVAFKWLGQPRPDRRITVKRIATTVLVAGLMATPMLALPPPAEAAISVGISVNIAPPPLPVYEQPIVPGPGYIWTPGYWAWDPGFGYYWVPGTWVMPPQIGLLWTPGWWGWSDGYYRWHPGYWGRHVGFYGGINYGHGYFGAGYVGGEWRGHHFYYNRAVNNVNVTYIHNVYVNRKVVRNVHVARVSYNGGRGGITAHPTAAQRSAASAHHWSPTSMQERQREVAKGNPGQRFKVNRGRPAVFATQHVGKFEGPHAVHAPSAPRGHATGASNDASRAAPRPRPANTPGRGDTMVQAPRDRTRPAPDNAPNRGHATVQAPHERAPGATADATAAFVPKRTCPRKRQAEPFAPGELAARAPQPAATQRPIEPGPAARIVVTRRRTRREAAERQAQARRRASELTMCGTCERGDPWSPRRRATRARLSREGRPAPRPIAPACRRSLRAGSTATPAPPPESARMRVRRARR
jgi:hypothetical protein